MPKYRIILIVICYTLFSTIELFSVSKLNEETIKFPNNTITDKGAWCWFADPRAIHYENERGTINSTYIGYIDVHGNIKATQIDHLTNTTNEVLIRSWFQPDDHNNPTFLVLPDERVMIFYSRHTDEACFYYRVSQKPGDITTLGKEIRLATSHNTTYPSPFILSDDPDHIYLCWRGIGWHPTIARLTIPDANDEAGFNWGPYQIVRSQEGKRGVRPYAKYQSNRKDKIYLAYTTTHPDNQSTNYVYLNYIDINTKELKDIKGNGLTVVGNNILHDVDATEAYKNEHPFSIVDDSPLRNWLWDLSIDKQGKPVIAMVSISNDKQSHDYYHVRWTGNEWKKTFLTNAGGHFHQSPEIENCYSGGMAIDKANPFIIYGSVPIEGKYGRVYELKKFTVAIDSDDVSEEQLTFDSPKNNIRPFVIFNDNYPQMAWMYGDYYDWIVSSSRPKGFPTAINTNMILPENSMNLQQGLLIDRNIGNVSQGKTKKVKVQNCKSFTVALTLSIDSASYYGDILSIKDFSYGIGSEGFPKPYVKNSNNIYTSTNVLGTSDSWQKGRRGTGGQWYPPEKLKTFQLAMSYEKGILKTYINGLVDQYIEIGSLPFSEVSVGGFNGVIHKLQVYDHVLTQNKIKALE